VRGRGGKLSVCVWLDSFPSNRETLNKLFGRGTIGWERSVPEVEVPRFLLTLVFDGFFFAFK